MVFGTARLLRRLGVRAGDLWRFRAEGVGTVGGEYKNFRYAGSACVPKISRPWGVEFLWGVRKVKLAVGFLKNFRQLCLFNY